MTALVNNAGVGVRAPFLTLEDAEWDRVIGVNLTGAFIVAQEAAIVMAPARRGSIVNMASISAFLAHDQLTAYSVSKAGLLALTRMMAFELAPIGVRVNAVAPGNHRNRLSRQEWSRRRPRLRDCDAFRLRDLARRKRSPA